MRAWPAFFRTWILIVGLCVLALGSAFFLQFAMGLQPCKLCLQQRWPYYLVLPVFAPIMLAAAHRRRAAALTAATAAAVVVFAAGGGVGVYHAGAEWGFWPGPSSCAGTPVSGSFADFSRALDAAADAAPPCDRAPWRLFGLSPAGYNVAISILCIAATLTCRRQALRRDAPPAATNPKTTPETTPKTTPETNP